ncbi:hypothetical protein IQ219_06950 [Synechocystis sp. LEGE 06083]|nr:hypothetical protein [Synechocystis sp. LEGE 06083]
MFAVTTNGLIMLGCFVGIVVIQNRNMDKSEQELSAEDYEELVNDEKINLEFLRRVPSMGLGNMIADWGYLGFVQYFGDVPARDNTGYGLLPQYYQLLVDKDPHFTDALSKLDVATSLFGGKPEASASFLGQALSKIPKRFITNIPPYYLWRAKGNNELLFAGNVDAAKKSYRHSMEWAKAYDDDESRRMININKDSLKFLANNPDSTEARIGAWVGILANRPDKKTVERVIKEIKALGANVVVEPNGNIRVTLPDNL